MIDDIIGNDEYTIDMVSDPTVLDKSCDYVPAMHMLKSDSSLWYETYKELASRNDNFDVSKKKMHFPDLSWGNDKNGPNFEEMKKRYLFLAENSLFLLAPLVREEKDGNRYLVNDLYLTVLIEKMMFGDDSLEDTELYHKLMEYKEDSKYLDIVKTNSTIMNKRPLSNDITNVDIAMFNILKRVRGYIEGQEKCFNKTRKLTILDEYFRIVRYSNDGKVWASGYELCDSDIKRNLNGEAIDPLGDRKVEITPANNRGVGHTKFISGFNVKRYKGAKGYVCYNLDENARQEIYLKLHDELPWNLELECKMEEPELDSMIDARLIRPDNTSPCGVSFRISEGDIFVSRRGFYHLCSECGFIVKVPPTLMSEGIKSRINERCSKDENLFRKMELISELQALDDRSLPHHKVLFKKMDEGKKKTDVESAGRKGYPIPEASEPLKIVY